MNTAEKMKGENEAGISVIIPTFNRERPLVRLLKMILEHERYPLYEVIVVDQTKEHSAEMRQFLKNLPAHIKLLHMSYQRGSRARNDGAKLAGYPVLLFLDDDIVPLPGFIARHAAYYQDPSVTAVTGPLYEGHTALRPRTDLSGEEAAQLADRKIMIWDAGFQYDACELNTCNMSIRKSCFFEIGGFDENFYGASEGDDFEFSYRLLQRKLRMVFAPDIPVHYSRTEPGGNRSYRGADKVESCVFNRLYYHYKVNKSAFEIIRTAWGLFRENVFYKQAIRSGECFGYFKAYVSGLIKFTGIIRDHRRPCRAGSGSS